MTGLTVLVAVLAGVFVACTVLAVRPPPHRLAERVAPYVQASRAALGTGQARTGLLEAGARRANSFTAVFAPIAETVTALLARAVDVDGPTGVERRLRQSGLAATMTADQYRHRQALYAIAGIGIGLAAPAISGQPLGIAIISAACGGFVGATRLKNRTTVLIRRRCETMRASLYTVCHLIAVHMATSTGGLLNAVRAVTVIASGPVSDELVETLNSITHGDDAVVSLTRTAEQTAEPSAARLYRMLAAETRGGDPTAALLDLANVLRLARRDELEREGVRRSAQMLLPLILVIAPIMILFVLAAIPSMLFRLTR